jgi:WD40 repeat protein
MMSTVLYQLILSSELEIKVIDLKDPTNIKKLEGHRKGVRKATWHPSGTILVRFLIVWNYIIYIIYFPL